MQIKLDDSALTHKLGIIAQRMTDLSPLSRSISMTLLDQNELNFAAEGRPKWAGLSPAYAATRKKGKILQITGHLARSILPFSGNGFAGLSTNVPYAAIQQFGGQTRPHIIKPKNAKALHFGGKFFKVVHHPGSKIPAREFMPVDKSGRLQPEALIAVTDDINLYWTRVVGS